MEFIEQRYPQLINDAIVSYVISFLSVYNEYIKRNQKWEKVLLYRNIARKELKKIFSNHRLSILKKAQITIFALSSNLYRIIIKK